MRDHYAKQYGSRSRSLCLKGGERRDPQNKYGRPTYPENVEINGYVNQFFVTNEAAAATSAWRAAAGGGLAARR